MITYRNGAYEVVVNIGLDPVTKRRRRVSRSVRMAERKRVPKAVLDIEAQLRQRVNAGQHDSPSPTVSVLLDAWLDHARPKLEATTVHGYERIVRLYLRPNLGNIRVSKLTARQLDLLYGRLLESGGVGGAALSPATVRSAHTALHRALQQALRWGWVHTNVATLAEPPTVKSSTTRTPTPEEVERLILTADDDLADLIAIAAGMGLRRGEACALRFSDLHDGYALVVRAAVEISHAVTVKAPKSGRARQVPLGPALAARLTARRERMSGRAARFDAPFPETAYVLSEEPDGAAPLHPNLASDRFRRHSRVQDIPVRLHDLRHAKATYALAAGVPAPDVANAQGWASTKMLFDTYGHHTPAHRDALAAVLDY